MIPSGKNRAAAGYAVFAVTGGLTWNLTPNLYGGAANSFANPTGTGIARDNATNTVQIDLNLQS